MKVALEEALMSSWELYKKTNAKQKLKGVFDKVQERMPSIGSEVAIIAVLMYAKQHDLVNALEIP